MIDTKSEKAVLNQAGQNKCSEKQKKTTGKQGVYACFSLSLIGDTLAISQLHMDRLVLLVIWHLLSCLKISLQVNGKLSVY